MPSDYLKKFADISLSEGESSKDFLEMTEILILKRKNENPELSYEKNEIISASILCWVVFPKPDNFIRTMQEYRLKFKGIHDSQKIKNDFISRIKKSTLETTHIKEISFRDPKLYFQFDGLDLDTRKPKAAAMAPASGQPTGASWPQSDRGADFIQEISVFLEKNEIDFSKNHQLTIDSETSVEVDFFFPEIDKQNKKKGVLRALSPKGPSGKHLMVNSTLRKWTEINSNIWKVSLLDDRFLNWKKNDVSPLEEFSEIIFWSERDKLIDKLK